MTSLALTLLLSGLVQIGLGNPMLPAAESAPSPATSSDEPSLCPCTSNATISTTAASPAYTANPLIHGMTCVCHAGETHRSQMSRGDYHYEPGVGAHKLHTRASSWNEARKICNEEGGHLAIVNSYTEAKVMKKLFAEAGPIKGASYTDLAYVGIHDLYKEGEFVTIQGESLYKAGYASWSNKWNGQPDNGGGNQNCGGFLKEGGLDDVNCDVPFAFFCEIPMTYIVH